MKFSFFKKYSPKRVSASGWDKVSLSAIIYSKFCLFVSRVRLIECLLPDGRVYICRVPHGHDTPLAGLYFRVLDLWSGRHQIWNSAFFLPLFAKVMQYWVGKGIIKIWFALKISLFTIFDYGLDVLLKVSAIHKMFFCSSCKPLENISLFT